MVVLIDQMPVLASNLNFAGRMKLTIVAQVFMCALMIANLVIRLLQETFMQPQNRDPLSIEKRLKFNHKADVS